MLDLVMSNHLSPLLNISCVTEFYATTAGSYLLHLLRTMILAWARDYSEIVFEKMADVF